MCRVVMTSDHAGAVMRLPSSQHVPRRDLRSRRCRKCERARPRPPAPRYAACSLACIPPAAVPFAIELARLRRRERLHDHAVGHHARDVGDEQQLVAPSATAIAAAASSPFTLSAEPSVPLASRLTGETTGT